MPRTFRTAGRPKLNPAEGDLFEMLVALVDRHGKLTNGGQIHASYDPPAENENIGIGVKCSNCALYRGPGDCRIVDEAIEPDGTCRFAIIPDGIVG